MKRVVPCRSGRRGDRRLCLERMELRNLFAAWDAGAAPNNSYGAPSNWIPDGVPPSNASIIWKNQANPALTSFDVELDVNRTVKNLTAQVAKQTLDLKGRNFTVSNTVGAAQTKFMLNGVPFGNPAVWTIKSSAGAGSFRAGNFSVQSGLEVLIERGATLHVKDTLLYVQSGGVLSVAADGAAILDKGYHIYPQGTIRAWQGGGWKAQAPGVSRGKVEINGTGGLGRVELDGDFEQVAPGTIETGIDGPVAGSGYDVFAVGDYDADGIGGNVSLGGSIDVSLGFQPDAWSVGTAGDYFSVITATGTLTGSLDSANLPDVSSQGLRWQVIYDRTDLYDTCLSSDFPGLFPATEDGQPWVGNGLKEVVLLLVEAETPDLKPVSAAPTGPNVLQFQHLTQDGPTGSYHAQLLAGSTVLQTVSVSGNATSTTFSVPTSPGGGSLLSGSESLTFRLDSQVGTCSATFGEVLETDELNNRLTIHSLSASDTSGDETPGGEVVFAVTMSQPSTLAVTVGFETQIDTSGTFPAAAGDFGATSGVLEFAPGETSKAVTVSIADDAVYENDETFRLRLFDPVNAFFFDADNHVVAEKVVLGTILDDGDRPHVNAHEDVSVDEAAGTLTLLATLSNASEREVVVAYATANITASAGVAPAGDYVAASGNLTFAPNATTASVTVAVTTDSLDEANETFAVNLSSATNAVLDDASTVVTIVDDDGAPTISIADASGVSEGTAGTPANATLTLSLSAVSGQDVVVNVHTWDYTLTNPLGAATAGSDYTALSDFAVTIPAGSTTATVTVAILHDTVDEVTEEFFVGLSSPQNVQIADGEARVTISDNDAAPGLSVLDATFSEAEYGTFTVRLAQAAERTIVVNYATTAVSATDGDDYVGVTGALTFSPGQTETSISVATFDDAIDEVNETYYVNLLDPDPSDPNDVTLTDAQAVGTILDNEGAPQLVLIEAQGTYEDDGPMVFEVYRYGETSQTVTVDYATVAGSATAGGDYVAASGTLTFAPGQYLRTVTVGLVSDTVYEVQESFALELANPTNATLGNTAATGTILNDDNAPGISIADVTVNEAAGNAVLTVTLDNISAFPVSALFHTWDLSHVCPYCGPEGAPAKHGVDYTAAESGALTIAAGSTTGTITIPIASDSLYEYDEEFFVVLTNIENASVTDQEARVLISDDDPAPSIQVADASVGEGQWMAFAVSLSAPTARPIQVSYLTVAGTAIEGTDYGAAGPSTIEFPIGETAPTVEVWVQTIDDGVDEYDETFTLQLSNPSPSAVVLADATGTGTIVDDDVPLLSIFGTSAYEGQTVPVQIEVTMSLPSDKTIVVTYATSNGTAVAPGDYATASATVTFSPGGSLSQAITLTVNDDTVTGEEPETFTVALSAPTNGAGVYSPYGTATVYVYDNDPADPLFLDRPAREETSSDILSAADVERLAAAALVKWQRAGVRLATLQSRLDSVHFAVVDLPGAQLGAAVTGAILIDKDAAGYGWFVDATPLDSQEFDLVISRTERQSTLHAVASGAVDLLTVLAHELGHALGLSEATHDDEGLMAGAIGLGTRRDPDAHLAREIERQNRTPGGASGRGIRDAYFTALGRQVVQLHVETAERRLGVRPPGLLDGSDAAEELFAALDLDGMSVP